ncbi:MAG: DUF1592 domain-containing protein [Planctomycetota bacterium]
MNVSLTLCAVIWICSLIFALPVQAEERVQKSGVALFKQFCFDCHSGGSSEAGNDIENLFLAKPIVKNRKSWNRIKQLIEYETMPPSDYDQPSSYERKLMLEWIQDNVDQFDYSTVKHPGWEPVRRMTHLEYNNTIRDLLGVKMNLVEKFPRELVGNTGFENSANTLFLQPALMERYIAAAERATTAANIFESSDTHQFNNALQQFLRRSYRRPIGKTEFEFYLENLSKLKRQGAGDAEAIKGIMAGVLISPDFLLRVESNSDQSGKISEHELATRLSYFLWASMPDDELLKLADDGRLSEPTVLRQQVQRMLGDRKSAGFVESFVGQWLSTRLVGKEIRLDPIDNAWCTDSLMQSMRIETLMFVAAIIKENRPITDLIDADFTYVNEELAKTLYGFQSIRGNRMRRIQLKGRGRRGILGHASVLAVTSNHDETSPIKRGAYVLDRILGTPPPPPPPDVGELDEELIENDRLSLAQKLRRHAADKKCASCHNTIDPIGIALEKFGAYGRTRKWAASTATLADGYELRGAEDLREYLLTQRRSDFVRNFVVRVMEYALGRETEYFDEPAIRKIIAEANENDLKIQSIVHSVVTSYPFQYRKENPK